MFYIDIVSIYPTQRCPPLKLLYPVLLFQGRLYSHDPCGRAFVALPVVSKQEEMNHVITNFDAIYNLITNQVSNDNSITLPVYNAGRMFM